MKIAEIFYSIQGEGGLTGVPAAFVRVAGCNLRCGWCDSKHASRRADGKDLPVKSVAAKLCGYPTKFCVITGGEPMLAEGINELAALLKKKGMHITIETNGTLPPKGISCDLASISPKLKSSTPRSGIAKATAEAHERARFAPETIRQWIKNYNCQLKFVVGSKKDMPEIKSVLRKAGAKLAPEQIFLMPEGGNRGELAARDLEVVGLCKRTGFRYCRRVHIDIFGSKKGV